MKRETFGVRRSAFVLACLGCVILYAALAFGIYNGLTRHALGANDFYSRWMGARALFLRGENPYSENVTREIQMGMYGQLARVDQDQVAFAYPLYAAYVAAPLVIFPYAVAQALWMALLVMGVVAGALALAFVNRLALSPITLAAILLGALFFYPSVRGIFLGQYALFSFTLVALASFAIATEHATTAGILLALASVKPQPVIFLLPLILFWAWCNGKRRVVWGALLILALLLGSSFLLVPSWFGDFLNGLQNYAQYAPVGPPLETFFKLFAPNSFATSLFFIASGLLIVGMLAFVWKHRAQNWFAFQTSLGFAALVTTLLAGRIGTPDQVLLLIPLFAWLGQAQSQTRRVLLIFVALGMLTAPWLVFLNLLEGDKEAIVVTTVLPLFVSAMFFALTFLGRHKSQPLRLT